LDVDSYRGRWLLVNFFAQWCGPCKVEHPQLVAFEREGRASGTAAVISVAFDDEPSAGEQFFEENGGDWPVVAEGNAAIPSDYGGGKPPRSYLIDHEATVVAKIEGGVTAADVWSRITRAEAGTS